MVRCQGRPAHWVMILGAPGKLMFLKSFEKRLSRAIAVFQNSVLQSATVRQPYQHTGIVLANSRYSSRALVSLLYSHHPPSREHSTTQ